MPHLCCVNDGGSGGSRTRGLFDANEALFRLSYTPEVDRPAKQLTFSDNTGLRPSRARLANRPLPRPRHCGSGGNRTHDPLLAKQVLYQLSYTPRSKRSQESNLADTCGSPPWRPGCHGDLPLGRDHASSAWWLLPESNRRPLAFQASALPTELSSRGAHRGIRTPTLSIRSRVLCPVELRARVDTLASVSFLFKEVICCACEGTKFVP